jgi:hypothetical protein
MDFVTKELETLLRNGKWLSPKKYNRLECALQKREKECYYENEYWKFRNPITVTFQIINRCGPACNVCCYAITDNILEKNGIQYHQKCYPCNLCNDTNKNISVSKDGYHPMCQPCKGCIKPYVHISQSVYCSPRCSTKAPIFDIISIRARRLSIYLCKDSLMLIYEFAFGPVLKSAKYYLSDETLQIIKLTEQAKSN